MDDGMLPKLGEVSVPAFAPDPGAGQKRWPCLYQLKLLFPDDRRPVPDALIRPHSVELTIESHEKCYSWLVTEAWIADY